MQILNLPKATFNLSKKGNLILLYDHLRKIKVVLTPEEWVRQHIVNYLIEVQKIAKGLIGIEKMIKINHISKRFDLVVYSTDLKIEMVIECKAPFIKVEDNEEIKLQSLNYFKALDTEKLLITNGLYFIGYTSRNGWLESTNVNEVFTFFL